VRRFSDVVAASHPALAGHFPGDPIVPGALLVARVVRAAAPLAGGPLCAVPVAKFHAPLRPGERFEIELEPEREATIAFRVLRGDVVLASGKLRFGERNAA
jgi:3-hydroxyacyl-[acyl-carrier-protein] dehydratase